MKTKQENRFSMYLAVVDFCEKNTGITTTLPNFSINLSKLKTTNRQIHVIAEVQAADISGTTVGKNDSRENLVVLGADTSRKLVAYATLTKNQKLLKEIKYTESDLRHLPDTNLAKRGETDLRSRPDSPGFAGQLPGYGRNSGRLTAGYRRL